MKYAIAIRTALLAAMFATAAADADVTLPRLLGDGAILQRDSETRLWGWADDGESVEILLDGELLLATSADEGRWDVRLPAQPAGGPHRIVVRGRNEVRIDDVYFGDVWVASGQSNMELPMERVSERFAADIASANFPTLRQFKVKKSYDFDAPHEDLDSGSWVAATPETVPDFSAVAFFFARAIQQSEGVPVGIINSSYGGSAAESWMSEDALADFPHYLDVARRYREDGVLQELLDGDKAMQDAWYAELGRMDDGLNGDVPWSDPAVDETGWWEATVPGYWDDASLEPINGVVWYRRTIELPDGVEGLPAKLKLGRIDDADTTWVNGIEVGNTTYQYPPRRYDIEPGVLRGGKNFIVVRVVNSDGIGGFVPDKPYELVVGETMVDLTGDWLQRLGGVSEPLPEPQFRDYRQPLGIYNAMLAPLQAMTIKGVIWYQGETNTDRPAEYAVLFPAMIRAWREQWGQGNFPFIYVQLANYLEAKDEPSESNWAETRDAQSGALAEPATAMAVTIDVGEWNDIHPLDKKTVGERLALGARHVAYGEEELVYSGPVCREIIVRPNMLVLQFEHYGRGLMSKGKPLGGFALAGSDGEFHWAEALIDDNTVRLRSRAVKKPAYVRYAWADNPDTANLYNKEGLPAVPFQASVARSPETIGTAAVDDLLSRGEFMMYRTEQFTGIHYAEAAMGFAALRFLATTGDQSRIAQVLQRYAGIDGIEDLQRAGHVDASVYGILPLQMYLQTGNEAYLHEGLRFADAQWIDPLDSGLSRESRFWIDDVWMVGALQVQAYRATGDPVYLDRAALQIDAYLDELQQPNGLFFHGEEARFFWGRGNGWVAAGLAELLSELPESHERYDAILAAYRRMMQALLEYQAGDGMWRQLVDDDAAWKETSATAMFAYAMVIGIRHGLLPDKRYVEAARKAWLALGTYIDADGLMSDVCVGTGQSDDRNYYLERPRATGDFHGQAALLWLSYALRT